MGVADGQCLEPMGGGFVVPEQMLLSLYRQCDEGAEQDGSNDSFHIYYLICRCKDTIKNWNKKTSGQETPFLGPEEGKTTNY